MEIERSRGNDSEYRGHGFFMRRRNSISGQFTARTIEMLESPAYRVLSRSAHLAIARVEIELAQHGGNDNDQLPVPTEDFIAYGMDRSSVSPALREAEALGFLRIKRGRGGNAEHRTPNRFGLTFAQHRNSRRNPPTDDWRRITTIAEAEQIARAARQAKDERAVAHGKRSWHKRQQKTESRYGKSIPKPVRKNRTENSKAPVRKTRTTGAVEKTVLLSISACGGRPAPPLTNSPAPQSSTCIQPMSPAPAGK
jgi:hypothetical protein